MKGNRDKLIYKTTQLTDKISYNEMMGNPISRLIYKTKQLADKVSYNEIRNKETQNKKTYDKKVKYHFGQLKLFMTELYFLSKYNDLKNALVLYVGAANGYHTWYMAKHMFPNFTFHLYDRSKFHNIFYEQKLDNVKIFPDYFSDKYAEKYKEHSTRLLYMCDMRDLDVRMFKSDSDTHERIVSKDMVDQMNWAKVMNPVASYLKFRLPYDEQYFEYFKGPIYIQPYAPNSTETRILVTNYTETRKYDCKEFDEKMAYFNFITRPKT